VYERSCLGMGPDVLTEDSSGLCQSLANEGLVPQIRLRPLPCTFLSFLYSVIRRCVVWDTDSAVA
jgi:hypothetical protein